MDARVCMRVNTRLMARGEGQWCGRGNGWGGGGGTRLDFLVQFLDEIGVLRGGQMRSVRQQIGGLCVCVQVCVRVQVW